jgi:uncharacterized membrane protein
MLGLVHTLTVLAMAGASTRGGDVQRLFSIPLVIMLVVILAGTVLFAQPPGASSSRHSRHWLLGLVHGLAHVALAVGGTWVWLHLEFRDWPWPLPLVVAAVGFGPLIGFVAAQVVALYLLVAGWYSVNVNELFAGQGIEDVKSFLRLHVAADGSLTVYPVAIDRISRSWRPDPDGAPGSPWLRPKQPLTVRLIEPPIVVSDAADRGAYSV